MKTSLAMPEQDQKRFYVNEYTGLWSMRENDFNALKARAESLQVSVHLTEQRAAQQVVSPKSEVEFLQGVSGPDGQVALFQVQGTILKHSSSWSGGTSTVRMRRAVRAAKADPLVGYGLLHIDSPGGSVRGLQDLWDDLSAFAEEKPLYAYIEDCGCSAAYELAVTADRVFMNKGGIAGSIGTYTVVYDLSQAAENEGIKVHVVKAGDFKGSAIAGTEVTQEQLDDIQRIIDQYNQDFLDNVAEGRGLPMERVQALADGRVHKGQSAVALDLVDAIQSLDLTVEQLVAEPPKQQRRSSMSQQQQTEQPDPKAVTVAELKKEFPESTSDWREGLIESSATMDDAHKAWSSYLAEQNKQLQEQLQSEKTRADEAEKSAKEPKGDGRVGSQRSEDEESGSSEATAYQNTYEKMRADGKSSREAHRTARRKHPQGHKEWTANQSHGSRESRVA